MVSKYYIAKRSQTNNRHAVHKEDCPFLPDDEKRIFLGHFQSGHDALTEGEKHFEHTNCCRFCINNDYQEHREPAFSEIDISVIIPTEKELSHVADETALYFFN